MEDICKIGFTWLRRGRVLGGYKSVAPKMDFLSLRARSALLARANFLRQTLITYKTFCKNRFSIFCFLTSKKRIVENGVYPPPTFVLTKGVLARQRRERIFFSGGGVWGGGDFCALHKYGRGRERIFWKKLRFLDGRLIFKAQIKNSMVTVSLYKNSCLLHTTKFKIKSHF